MNWFAPFTEHLKIKERMELMLEEVVDVSFLTSSTDEDSRKALERRNAWAPRFVTAVPSRSKLWPHAPVATGGGYDSSSGPVQCPVATMFAYIEGKIQKEALYLQVTSMDGTKGKSGGGKRSQRQQHLKTPGAPVEERNGALGPIGQRIQQMGIDPAATVTKAHKKVAKTRFPNADGHAVGLFAMLATAICLAALTAAVCPRLKHTTPARVTKTSSST
jgi:hypothetical protein